LSRCTRVHAKPGDIPIEQSTRLNAIVNPKTAKALGLEIPPTVLAAADEAMRRRGFSACSGRLLNRQFGGVGLLDDRPLLPAQLSRP
jgi:hypothetical protein